MEAAGYRWHHWAKWECWWQTVAGVTVAPACFQQVIGPKGVSVWTTEKDSLTDSEITFFVTCIETECLQMLANKQTKCAARTQRSLKGTQLADILPASCRFTHWRPSAHRGPVGQSTNLLTEPRHWHLSFFLFFFGHVRSAARGRVSFPHNTLCSFIYRKVFWRKNEKSQISQKPLFRRDCK